MNRKSYIKVIGIQNLIIMLLIETGGRKGILRNKRA